MIKPIASVLLTAWLFLSTSAPASEHQAVRHASQAPANPSKGTNMRAEREFSFELPGSVSDITPYFGPVKESEWWPQWQPRFIHPIGGDQVAGAIFETDSALGRSVWVMDRFEPEHGRVGYVIFVNGVGVSRYQITVSQIGPDSVRVRVWCSRTAFGEEGLPYVAKFEELFEHQGPGWQEAILKVLKHADIES